MNTMKASEIQVTPIYHVNASVLEDHTVEDVDVVNLAMSNNSKGGNAGTDVEQGVHFDGRFVSAESGLGKQLQTQIDGCGIQSVDRLIELLRKFLARIKLPGFLNHNLRKVRLNTPAANRVGIRQSVPGNFSANAHMIKFDLSRTKTSLDIAQNLPEGQLSKCHAQILIPTGKRFDLVFAAITLDTFLKLVGRNKIRQLRKYSPARIHEFFLSLCRQGKTLLWPFPISNRKMSFRFENHLVSAYLLLYRN